MSSCGNVAMDGEAGVKEYANVSSLQVSYFIYDINYNKFIQLFVCVCMQGRKEMFFK